MRLIKSAMAAFAALAATSLSGAKAAPVALATDPGGGDPWSGDWSGAAVSAAGAVTDVQLRFGQDGAARVYYPRTRCEGVLRAHARLGQARVYRAADVTSKDGRPCLQSATVVLREDGAGLLRYRVLTEATGVGAVAAAGALRRAPPLVFAQAAAPPAPAPAAQAPPVASASPLSLFGQFAAPDGATAQAAEPELAGGPASK